MGQISSGNPQNSNQDIIVSGNGTAGTPDAGVVSVQGVASGTPILVNPAGTNQFYIYSPQLNSVIFSEGSGISIGGEPGILTLAECVASAELPVGATNATTRALIVDTQGYLKTLEHNTGLPVSLSGAWTSSTTINTTKQLVNDGTTNDNAFPSSVPAILVTLDQTSTLTAGAVTFQLSYDGNSYINVPASQLLDPSTLAQISNPYSFQASTNKSFLILLQGALYVQANLTTLITGSGGVAFFTQQVCYQPWMSLDSSGYLNVHVQSGGGSGTQYADAASSGSHPTGTAVVGWNSGGSTMQAIHTDGSNNLNVNVQAATLGTVTVSGTVAVSNSFALDSSVNGILVAQGSTTSGQSGPLVQTATTTNAPTYSTAKTNPLSTDTSGLLRVSLKDTPANTNAFKVDGSAVTQPVSIAATVTTSTVPVTSGGCSTAVSQALTTTINVKASAGQLYGYAISNPNASPIYIMYYNTATTPGTIGSTTNLIFECACPASGTMNVSFDNGIAFSSGIAVAVATTATGNTAPGTGLVITSLYK